MAIDVEEREDKDMKNALDLSESEDEEEIEDLAEHFTRKNAFREIEVRYAEVRLRGLSKSVGSLDRRHRRTIIFLPVPSSVPFFRTRHRHDPR